MDAAHVVVVVGASGEDEFGRQFSEWALFWQKAAQAAGARFTGFGLGPEATNDLRAIERFFEVEPKESLGELWLVLLGHGTFDGQEAKFNLRGRDLSATELERWLEPFRRPVAVINATGSSSPFLNKLSGANRVIITATKSGYEQNYARFGQFISQTIADPKADLDKDGQTSLLEAFLSASARVAQFYTQEGRLATEHALIDDNGDGQGTPADWFRGIRATKKAADGAALDGFRAHQWHLIRSPTEQQLSAERRTKRDALESAIAKLRDTKSTLAEDEYYSKLELLLVELARLYSELK